MTDAAPTAMPPMTRKKIRIASVGESPVPIALIKKSPAASHIALIRPNRSATRPAMNAPIAAPISADDTAKFYSFVEFGYGTGVNAPGLKLPPAQLNQVRHHAVLGHGLATQAIRARARPGTRVGPVDNITVGVPAIETPEHVRAAEVATRELNAPYLTVMLEGRYTDAYLAAAGAAAPRFTDEDMRAIASPVDFVGL